MQVITGAKPLLRVLQQLLPVERSTVSRPKVHDEGEHTLPGHLSMFS